MTRKCNQVGLVNIVALEALIAAGRAKPVLSVSAPQPEPLAPRPYLDELEVDTRIARRKHRVKAKDRRREQRIAIAHKRGQENFSMRDALSGWKYEK